MPDCEKCGRRIYHSRKVVGTKSHARTGLPLPIYVHKSNCKKGVK